MKFLTIIVVTLLSLQIGFTNTVLQEIYRLPFLIQHYCEHTEETSIDLKDFFKLHYSENEHKTKKKANHNHASLPFHNSLNTVHINPFIFAEHSFDNPEKPFAIKSDIKIPDHTYYIPQNLINSIWHPPKNNIL
ncbi:hypothetical protein M2459_002315 [Parabacteroides sp. PF5-5]|uniref:hypothetical protein n=1 Tax=Dysgonomonas sp. PH5-45 TaxID=1742396 RepID=UPI0024747B15|nr:hypothetical protein [Dysgonomonas sp. PH5-45]MDH6305218.1 hypothetical protein [Parabacteroides sp. PH5-39]MDH6316568.1 hypothetical protein [Parabacteroides sp. PF5-13]MDH6320078.1 hypothetical protein [Parabacteroides sp. PH5-13]MDH6323689.1 hypothetical protein [Parabacteroides sp. PH5-8]MDH6327755.1 hypothetical protein [Parabacteroides sp. PH5-41]MDH6335556.1 hypothetical protein [Parabacteroides sp. PF5-5]MDH6346500.1 hypothetical protein [Parabacteroides sp. PH5-46]MDH6357464.1 h